MPKVGDKLKRGGGGEWTVTAVERDSSGNVVVTLMAATYATSPNRDRDGYAAAREDCAARRA